MKLSNNQLKTLLLSSNLITDEKIELAEKEANKQRINLLDFLCNSNLVSPGQISQTIAEALKFNFIDLSRENIDLEALNIIPEAVARTRGVVAFARTVEGIRVGMVDPDDLETKYLVEKKIGAKAIIFYITRVGLEHALAKYGGKAGQQLDEILLKIRKETSRSDEKDKMALEAVNLLLQYAHENKASDIHIEPYTNKAVVRFRIDGVMHDIVFLSKETQELMLFGIKLMAGLRTDQYRAEQEGRLEFRTKEAYLSISVFIWPIVAGEKAIMRFSTAKLRLIRLSGLGLSDKNLEKIKNYIGGQPGLILVAGPTGSGRTTTIYAMLKLLHKQEVNIASIEDPVEHSIAGVNQLQVDAKTNLTFANGLRAILSQDPDIIMIGEICNQETAKTAVNSALTGRQVLSALPVNDAATALSRLLEMNVEPFAVASTVNIIIAQRLVRKICPKCITSYSPTEEELMIINQEGHIKEVFQLQGCDDLPALRFYKGNGCTACGNTGFKGRLGIFEVLEMSEELRSMLAAKASSRQLFEVAKQLGMTTMLSDGLDKVSKGLTTFMEVVRATRD
jgi:type II secretory ATPase GspE/PulE/Tfp pilus assembly ATPase PilB-like protein